MNSWLDPANDVGPNDLKVAEFYAAEHEAAVKAARKARLARAYVMMRRRIAEHNRKAIQRAGRQTK